MSKSTAEQLQVIHHGAGHALVSAVAGSGKTTTLIERILFLLEQGADPKRMLVLMFNRDAKEQFARRLSERSTGRMVPEIFTFHGFGNRLSKSLINVGLLPPATLLAGDHRAIRFGREVLSDLNVLQPAGQGLDLSSELVVDFLDAVDMLKGSLVDGSALAKIPKQSIDKRFIAAFPAFEHKRAEESVRMLADLIYDPVMLALRNADVARRIGNRYDHVIVDEYQDINEAQMALVRLVAGSRAQVLVVGDEDQTIYGWRGARSDYMTHVFEKEFPGAKRFAITQTFRFGHSLCLLANHLIANNTERMDKFSISSAQHQTVISVRMHTKGCGEKLVEEISRWRGEGGRLSECAILLRQYANSIPVEIALHRAGIPYRIVGAVPFVDREEIVALRGYLRLVCSDLSVPDAANVLPKMVEGLLSVPTLYLRREEKAQLVDAVSSMAAFDLDFLADCLCARNGIKPFTLHARNDAIDTWRWCRRQSADMPAARFLADLFRRINLFEYISKNNPQGDVAEEKSRMVRQIADLAYAGRYSVRALLNELEELSSSFVAADSSSDEDRLLVTSCHRAKGLEFPLVILPDLAEGLFPRCSIDSTAGDIADERRLFYVAATRAIKELILITPLDRQLLLWSKERRSGHPPVDQILASRFLYESNIELSVVAGDAIGKSAALPTGNQSRVLSTYIDGIAQANG